MKAYTFRNGDFKIDIHSESVTAAHKKLDELLGIIERQIAFDTVPLAKQFELIDIKDVK